MFGKEQWEVWRFGVEMREGLCFGKGREGDTALMFWGDEMQGCCLGKRTNRFGVWRR